MQFNLEPGIYLFNYDFLSADVNINDWFNHTLLAYVPEGAESWDQVLKIEATSKSPLYPLQSYDVYSSIPILDANGETIEAINVDGSDFVLNKLQISQQDLNDKWNILSSIASYIGGMDLTYEISGPNCHTLISTLLGFIDIDWVNAFSVVESNKNLIGIEPMELDISDINIINGFSNYGGLRDNYLVGGVNEDFFSGGDGNDNLNGGGGHDIILGEFGDDILAGGGDNDILEGGEGVNTYILHKGDGSDIIRITSGLDRLMIDANPETLEIKRGSGNSSRDLIISYGNGDQVTIEGFYNSPDNQLSMMTIGSCVYTTHDLIMAGLDYHGTDQGETIIGVNGYDNIITSHKGVDHIYTKVGDDTIYADEDDFGDVISTGSRNDIIHSGGGLDILNGGDGNDTYYISGGPDKIHDANKFGIYDSDSIVLANEAIKTEVTAKKNGNDLVIYYDASNKSNLITVSNWYSGFGNKIETLILGSNANAESMTWQELEALADKKDPGEELTDLLGAIEIPTAIRTYDPLVLDLDGDGIHTFGLNQSVHFDHDDDGIREQTGWIHGSDGFLALDLNGNGEIDSGTELFGNNTYAAFDGNGNGTEKATNGYSALAYHDINEDGVINADDDIFGDLRVWTDLNGDGISQGNELSSLVDLNIKSINLFATQENTSTGNGNRVAYQSNYERTDGVAMITQSLDLIFDTFTVKSDVEISAELVGLPDIAGTGFSTTLLQAATTHEPLANILKAMIFAPTRVERIALIDSLILEWAKSSTAFSDFYERTERFKSENPGSQASIEFGYADDKILTVWDKIAITEVFAGIILINADEIGFNSQLNLIGIESFYKTLKSFILTSIEDQSSLQGYKSAAFPNNNFDEINISAITSKFESEVQINQAKAISEFMSFTGYYFEELVAAGFDAKNYIIEMILRLPLDEQSTAVLRTFSGVSESSIEIYGKSANYFDFLVLGDGSNDILIGGSSQDLVV